MLILSYMMANPWSNVGSYSTFTQKENIGFSYLTNSYELTNLIVDTFKTHAISGNQSWMIQAMED